MKPNTHPRISPLPVEGGVTKFSVETPKGTRTMTGADLREYLVEQMAQAHDEQFRVEILLPARSVEQALADLASLGHALTPDPGSALEAEAEEEPDIDPDAPSSPGSP